VVKPKKTIMSNCLSVQYYNSAIQSGSIIPDEALVILSATEKERFISYIRDIPSDDFIIYWGQHPKRSIVDNDIHSICPDFVSDTCWIWNTAVAIYLQHMDTLPRQFVSHVHSMGYRFPKSIAMETLHSNLSNPLNLSRSSPVIIFT